VKRIPLLILTVVATLLLSFAWFYGVSPVIQKIKTINCMDDIRELNVVLFGYREKIGSYPKTLDQIFNEKWMDPGFLKGMQTRNWLKQLRYYPPPNFDATDKKRIILLLPVYEGAIVCYLDDQKEYIRRK
jgi:hypothetical protein